MSEEDESDSNRKIEQNPAQIDMELEQETRTKFHAMGITDKDIDEERERFEKQEADRQTEEKKLEKKAKAKLVRFQPTKLTGFNAKRIEHTYFDEKGNKFAFIQERRQKPYTNEVRIIPKGKKNPDKDILASVGEFPHKTQIFRYTNQEDYVYVSNGVDIVRIDRKDIFKIVLQLLGRTVVDSGLTQDIGDADLWLQIFSKSKLPHLKLKDWRKDNRYTTITPEQLDKEFIDNEQIREDERRSFGDYHKRKSMT